MTGEVPVDPQLTVDPTRFREVMGQYPTGVVVITALGPAGEPLGMVVGSFSSVSLEPQLVAFMPDKKSTSWGKLSEVDRFCANVLGSHQEQVCRALASRKESKFEGIAWRRSDQGNPVLEGAVAYVECTREATYEAGDHLIVLGRVSGLSMENPAMPLLFFRGGYGAFSPLSMAAADVDLVDRLRIVDLIRGAMEATASEYGTEVTAVSLVRDELVLTAAAGRATTATFPTRVGQRLPFMPPVGGVFAAWGSSAVRDSWLSHVEVDADGTRGLSCQDMIERIRSRGYAIGIGHERSQHWEDASFRASTGDPLVTTEVLRRRIAAVTDDYNPKDLAEGTNHELRFAQAPVFDANGEVVLALTLWGPAGAISKAQIDDFTAGLVDMAVQATATIGGQPPHDYPATGGQP